MFQESRKLLFRHLESRLQELRLYLVLFIPDIDAGAALRIQTVECALYLEVFQGLRDIIAGMAAHEPGGNHSRPGDRRGLGDIKPFPSRRIGALLYAVDIAYPEFFYYITLINGCV